MDKLFNHFLITRFNVPWVNGISPNERWLKNRMDLFLKYCLPSVYQQTNTNFQWIIYLDTKTPIWVFDILYAKTHSNTRLIKVNTFNEMKLQVCNDVVNFCEKKSNFIITSRLDNDDLISPHFIDLIQQNFTPRHNGFINFNCGICYHLKKKILSEYTYFNGPFVSKIENVETQLTTILEHDHTFLNAEIQIKGNHWIQLIHKGNISNGLKGKILLDNNLLNAINWVDSFDLEINVLNSVYWQVNQILKKTMLRIKNSVKNIMQYA